MNVINQKCISLIMDNSQAQYQRKYTELQLLGRGNYGSAYVVRSNQNGKFYVAKKMNLDGMAQVEIEAAKGEIQILKKFSDTNLYPFIVKYIECFCFEKSLIIVMQYCEYVGGDLATFLKHAKKKGQLIQQKIILAWFIMLVMGIQALHSKNVLHRDLKSANVFLTSNKFVKIGDFGISKVLDSTSAKTFVGTPYYLSPEVCSNKKYDLRSDLWSLGCILYELCTLNYPFQANNILSLAMKITSQEVTPISNKYPKQLNAIVVGLLTKDQSKRLGLEDILKMPYMQKFMNEYGNKIDQICQSIPLKKNVRLQGMKSNEGTIKQDTIKSGDSTAQDTMKTIKSNFQKTNNSGTLFENKSFKNDTLNYSLTGTGMSPKDLMKMRKQQQTRKKQQLMAQAAREQLEDVRNFARSKKQQQFSSSGSKFGPNYNAKTLQRKYQNQNKLASEQKYKRKNGLNDNQSIDLEQLSEACQLTRKMNGLTLTKNYSNVEVTPCVQKKIEAVNQNFKVYTKPVQQSSFEEEQLEQYYDDDFEDYVADEEDKAKVEIENDVLKSIISVVAGKKDDISPSKLAVVQKTFQKKPIVSMGNKQKKQQCIKQCINIVKQPRYKLLYELVSKCYKGQQYVETAELKQLRKHGSAMEKQALKLIDQIKYYEFLQ